MVKVFLVLSLYIFFPFLIIELYKRFRFVRSLGVVVLAYAIGIIMALVGLTEFQVSEDKIIFDKWQNILMNISITISIPLLLFHCDLKLWARSLPKTFFVLGSGVLAVFISILGGYLVFKNVGIPEFNKVCSIMMGIYTGGTMNFNALGASLGIDKTLMTVVLAFEMVLTSIYLFFVIGGGYKFYRKMLPKQVEEAYRDGGQKDLETIEIENYSGLLNKQNFKGSVSGLLLSLLIFVIGVTISFALFGKINEVIVILTVTTLALVCSFFKKVRSLPKTFELGMYFILSFSVAAASLFDWRCLHSNVLGVGLLILWTIVISSLLHLLVCKIHKVDGDLFTISQVALLCSPPFVPPIASILKNRSIMLSGIVIGLIGYAAGTYLGVLMNYLIEWLSRL